MKNTRRIIKKAIDSYPGGICFSNAEGRIILANRKINDLVAEITGHSILNAVVAWEKLTRISDVGDEKSLRQLWLPKQPSHRDGRFYSQLFFQLKDGTVWRFERCMLDEITMQIEAADITMLFQLSQELYENSIQLQGMQERQRSLLDDIVRINQSKELLAAKMRIHDEFGRCLLSTNRAIAEGSIPENEEPLLESWNKTVDSFLTIPEADVETEFALQTELQEVCELIGCRIIYIGNMPAREKSLRLLFVAVREALTNAVRHADASELTVQITNRPHADHVEISDNGEGGIFSITEGSGLGALRRRLEQEGATLDITCDGHVVLHIDLPV